MPNASLNQTHLPRARADERACNKAILDTLKYRAIFKYPLSFHQLYTMLISKKPFSHEFFNKELKKMVKKKYIETKDGKFFFKGIKPISWETRAKQTKNSLIQIAHVFKILSKIPWIKMVGVTGSVAAYNTDKESDVDIFIVSSKNRLWITRGFVALMLKLAGVYTRPGDQSGKICPNLFVDEINLKWPEKKRNIYTAHEIAMLQPVINRDQTYFKFMVENKWISNHFPHFKFEHVETKDTIKSSPVLDLIENLAFKMQLKYMQKKKINEITETHLIHFNKNDNSGWILEKYNLSA